MSSKLWATVVLSMLSCQPGEPSGPGGTVLATQSGTRIKVRRAASSLSTPDGARIETLSAPTFFDTKHGAYCFPMKAEDGKTRCLPGTVSPLLNHFWDRNCTVQILLVARPTCGDTQTDPYLVTIPAAAPGECGTGGQFAVYEVGGEVGIDGLYTKGPMGCALLDQATVKIYQEIYKPYRIIHFREKRSPADFVLVTDETSQVQ